MGRPKGSKNHVNKTKSIPIIPASHINDITKEDILFNKLILVLFRTKRDLNIDDVIIQRAIKRVFNEVKL